jgi:hypothetical protein
VFSSARVMAGITGAATSETYGNTATTAAP